MRFPVHWRVLDRKSVVEGKVTGVQTCALPIFSVAGQAFLIRNPDAVKEVSVQTSNFDAEFGRAGGGVVNLITRSGTNDFHGSLGYVLDSTRDDAISSSLARSRSEERRGGKSDWSSDVCSSDLLCGGPGLFDPESRCGQGSFCSDVELRCGIRPRRGRSREPNHAVRN